MTVIKQVAYLGFCMMMVTLVAVDCILIAYAIILV